ncbi:MAG: hypothetical protein ACFCAD_02685 [Pleurocapsa sp.]
MLIAIYLGNYKIVTNKDFKNIAEQTKIDFFTLNANEFRLILKRENNKYWYRLFLVHNKTINEIGADNIKFIIQKFLLILESDNLPTF